MQYFKQAVQTRQPEHCAKHTNQRQKRRKETMCGQSPSSPVYLRTVRQCVRLSLRVLPSYQIHSVRINVDGNMVRVMSVRSGREAKLLSF